MEDLVEKEKGLLVWFASNHVAANILMMLIIGGGIISLLTTTVEIFPDMSVDIITVTVPYLGASPAESEEGVCVKVEEAVAGIEGVKRLYSTAYEGLGAIMIEVEEYADIKEVYRDVEAEVGRIITFPRETEKPIITEITTRHHVISLVLYGDVPERTLKNLAEFMRDDLTATPLIWAGSSSWSVASLRDSQTPPQICSGFQMAHSGWSGYGLNRSVGRLA